MYSFCYYLLAPIVPRQLVYPLSSSTPIVLPNNTSSMPDSIDLIPMGKTMLYFIDIPKDR